MGIEEKTVTALPFGVLYWARRPQREGTTIEFELRSRHVSGVMPVRQRSCLSGKERVVKTLPSLDLVETKLCLYLNRRA